MSTDADEPPPILCVWCGAPWSDDNLSAWITSMSAGCESCGHGAGAEITIRIDCHACGKLMYRKDGLEVER